MLLLDRWLLVRDGLRALISRERDLEVVAEAAYLEEALAVDATPDVIVTETALRDVRGAAVIARLRQRFPDAAILVLTGVSQLREVEAALAAGADGYCAKDAPATEVVDAIRKVHCGESYVQPSLGAAMARRLELGGTQQSALTTREVEVLTLLALGHTNAEISDMLHIALRTAEAHRSNLLDKLGVRNRAGLVRYAIEMGLLDTRPESSRVAAFRVAG